MKTLGLIGGMSWESTGMYYQIINDEVSQILGGLHSAPMVIYSFDFEEIATLQKNGLWEQATARMVEAALALKAAGAEALVICTNTMHKMAHEVEAAATLPLLHIADCVGEAIAAQGIDTVGLLGTAFTMEQPFYRQRLKEKFSINVLVPDEQDKALVHRVIYEELCKGVVNPDSLMDYYTVMKKLKERGAQGIVLGCTEIGLLVKNGEAVGLPLFDTTLIHARYAAQYAMQFP